MKYEQFSNSNNNFANITINDNIILTKSIFCGISSICCLSFMIIYLILNLQLKLCLCIGKNDDDNDYDDNNLDKYFNNDNFWKRDNVNHKDLGKISLVSNFMLLLAFSNFLGSLFEFLFYFYYEKKIDENAEDNIYNIINDDHICHLFGFSRNFFDLFSICWTMMITLLVYNLKYKSQEILTNQKKYFVIGFIYSFMFSLIFTGMPYLMKKYGFSRYYCSFKYESNRGRNNLEEGIWRDLYLIANFVSLLLIVIYFLKANKFFTKTLFLTKKINEIRQKSILKYVQVFRIFPIIVIISRLFRFVSRVIVEKFDVSQFENVIQYCNGFFFASSGIFDSIACIIFFDLVFISLSKSEPKQKSSLLSKNNSDLNRLEINSTDE